MPADHGGHRVVGPEEFGLVTAGEFAELLGVSLVGHAVGEAFSAGAAATQVHGQCRIAPLGPEGCPLGEGSPAAAVHQDHGR